MKSFFHIGLSCDNAIVFLFVCFFFFLETSCKMKLLPGDQPAQKYWKSLICEGKFCRQLCKPQGSTEKSRILIAACSIIKSYQGADILQA